ncbi:MAG: hypothetical protein HY315_09115 [Acidobacteria bacterium]|nr:hypothetical protein [Acidobacteriota bacterium]
MRLLRCIRTALENVRQNMLVVWLPWGITLTVAWVAIEIAPCTHGWAAPGHGLTLQERLMRSASWLPTLELSAYLGIPSTASEGPPVWLGIVLVLLRVLADAGVIVFLSAPVLERRLRRFFSVSRIYAGRFLRLLLVTLTCELCLMYMTFTLWKVFNGNPSGWNWEEFVAFSWAAIALVFAFPVAASYARVKTVVEERTSMILAWMSALRFVARNAGPVLGIALIQLAPAVLMLGMQRGARVGAHRVSLTIVAAALPYGAAWISSWLKAVSYGAQIELVRSAPEAKGVRLFRLQPWQGPE